MISTMAAPAEGPFDAGQGYTSHELDDQMHRCLASELASFNVRSLMRIVVKLDTKSGKLTLVLTI